MPIAVKPVIGWKEVVPKNGSMNDKVASQSYRIEENGFKAFDLLKHFGFTFSMSRSLDGFETMALDFLLRPQVNLRSLCNA